MQPHDPKCPGRTDTLQRAAELIARAYTNREMAEIEFVTMHGAKKQVGRVRQHLEADYHVRLLGRGELIRFCRDRGFGEGFVPVLGTPGPSVAL